MTAKYQNPFSHGINTCHAATLLRKDHLEHLAFVKGYTGVRSVRCHGIFHDRIGVASLAGQHGSAAPGDAPTAASSRRGKLQFHVAQAHRVYDNLLEIGLTPFVELSFLPRVLAADPTKTICWYQAYCGGPTSYAAWGELIAAFARSLLRRYGRRRLAAWHFEVWNEPNIDFWQVPGDRFTEYMKLYAAAAAALKSAEARSGSAAPSPCGEWIARFIDCAKRRGLPIDFISTHIYPADEYEVHGPEVRRNSARSIITRGPSWRSMTSCTANCRASKSTGTKPTPATIPPTRTATPAIIPRGSFSPDSPPGASDNVDDMPQSGASRPAGGHDAPPGPAPLLVDRQRHLRGVAARPPAVSGRARPGQPLRHPQADSPCASFRPSPRRRDDPPRQAKDGAGYLAVRKNRRRLILAWNYAHPELPPANTTLEFAPAIGPVPRSAGRAGRSNPRQRPGPMAQTGRPLDLDAAAYSQILTASRLRPRRSAVAWTPKGDFGWRRFLRPD